MYVCMYVWFECVHHEYELVTNAHTFAVKNESTEKKLLLQTLTSCCIIITKSAQ